MKKPDNLCATIIQGWISAELGLLVFGLLVLIGTLAWNSFSN